MKKSGKKKTHVPFRLNMLFFIVFILFSVLILRLGMVQIVYGDDYKREIERTEDVTVNNPVPRGKMYDRNGKVIVDNTPLNAITYTRQAGADTEEMLKTAEKLAKLIHMDTKKVTERDKKDFWIMHHEEAAKKKITKAETKLYEEKKITDKELYNKQLSRITQKELNTITEDQMQVLAIYREFSSGYALTPQVVKNKDVSDKEFAVVSENLEKLPGVETTTDWDRKYPFGSPLQTILGKVTSSEEGLPSEQLDYFLASDYSRNDRVGKSYIEQEYEDVLHGQKAKVKNVTDKAGNVIHSQKVSDGQRGKDLVLTIDMELQTAVEKIIEQELKDKKHNYSDTQLLERAFVVMMDPNTGEILTMAGKDYKKDEKTGKYKMNDFALGNLSTSYAMGSAVKGATVLTGYKTGVLTPGQRILDARMKIKGTKDKGSWQTMGVIDDLTALKRSSNVYMFKTAIAIGKGNYVPGQSLDVDTAAFSTLRDSYSQFGLGVRTGIDLPNEQNGFKGTGDGPGLLMDLSIGQYDTYTPLQLVQYVSTIANGGSRLQPHLVKEIREPIDDNGKMGPVVEEMAPTVLNRLDMKPEWIDRVQEGFRQVMQDPRGTAASGFIDAEYKPAGKTGTAEAFYDGPKRSQFKEPPQTMNITLVSYAPYNNPEIAMAVVVPWAYQSSEGHHMNLDIGRKAYDAYFKLKKERSEKESNESASEDVNNQSGQNE
ncbi:cell division protein FtsI/penicillin-binding protein 2 [Peribacillus deserti]|uniref:serine-type D-Ala-D-Ala carboxypeptidase n=1 Tax=Peribacillus deserti TaxID=673318 RepID=A0ABS2QK30_9BACI|nr:penicillin-binding protein 2 [Peribacillus deserti]MBM7693310.1 cell division protein FtsI/penicillin-binding protein 2 [Peribacillus deserti]